MVVADKTKKLSAVVQSLYTGKLHVIAETFMNLYQLLMFVGALAYVWSLKKNTDVSKLVLLICILGGFLFHILWEGKSQYIISYFPLFLPCASMGIINMADMIVSKKGKKEVDGIFSKK